MTDKKKYPNAAGYKGDKATGREAAEEVTQSLGRRHAQTMAGFAPYGAAGATCDQVAADLDMELLHLRPRASELEKLGKLFVVGKAMGSYGSKVTVYSTIEPDESEPMAIAA